jgi:hypothetical protein
LAMMTEAALEALEGSDCMKKFYCNGKKGLCEINTDCYGCQFEDGSGGAEIEVEDPADLNFNSPYWERIEVIAERQREKGLSKYGQGLEMNPASIVERINHLQEELIDGLMYCEWIKDHLWGAANDTE